MILPNNWNHAQSAWTSWEDSTPVSPASDWTAKPDILQTGMQMIQHGFEEVPLLRNTALCLTLIGGGCFMAKQAINAFREGKSGQATKWTILSLASLGTGIAGMLYTGYNLYQNVTTVTSQKEFLTYDSDKHFTYSTQDYNQYGDPIGPRLKMWTGTCYANPETQKLCFEDGRAERYGEHN